MSSTEPLRDMFDAGGRGLHHQGLRRANERAVLSIIGFNPGVSNADISRLSGLAPQTVSAILVDIERLGLIVRGEVLRGRRGQPATPIFLKPDGALAIGVNIGWQHVTVLLLNMHAQVLGQRRRTQPFPDAATIVDEIAAMVAEVSAAVPDDTRRRIVGMGIATPTGIGARTGQMPASPDQSALWSRLDLAAELRDRTGLAVSVFNDGNAACWSQLIAFPKPRPDSFIYLLVSHTLTAGIVGEGTLWEGPTGNSANLGAMLVPDRSGTLRAAGDIASTGSLAVRLQAAGMWFDDIDPANWDWNAFGATLDQWIDESAEALARVVLNTSMVMETNLVIVDGVMPTPVLERLSAAVATQLAAFGQPAYAPPQLRAGTMGALAPAIGAAELTLYRRHLSRTWADLVGLG